MTARQSIKKPAKPYPEFPFTANSSGSWVKKFQGRQYVCGRWADDPKDVLARWAEIRNRLEVGEAPTPRSGSLTVKRCLFGYLDAKSVRVSIGELSPRTLEEYRRLSEWLSGELGPHRLVESLKADDFTRLRSRFPKSWGYHQTKKRIAFTRSVFRWADKADLLDRPVKFGSEFEVPSKKTQRREKRKRADKFFSREEIHRLLARSSVQLRAMILLGLNCGYGNADISRLRVSDVRGVWLDVPRGKTESERRAWLWPETRNALREVLKARESSPVKVREDFVDRLFLTHHGREWSPDESDYCAIAIEFAKLKKAAKCHRKGAGFYSLRHTCRTVADGSKDFPACRRILGHELDGMDAVYVEKISDRRLRAVCQHVRTWLYGKEAK